MNRFIEKPDCFLDTETNLEWQKEQNQETLNWQGAIEYCESVGPGWRLPTRKELFSSVEDDKSDPCTDLPGMIPSNYWSSTTDVLSTDVAWRVDFDYGYVHDVSKSNAYYVRAVRSGKGGE